MSARHSRRVSDYLSHILQPIERINRCVAGQDRSAFLMIETKYAHADDALASSLAMISLHFATHSSQMKTPLGPAIMCRTSALALPQNEHSYGLFS